MAFRDELIARAVAQWTWFGQDKGRGDKFIGPDGKTTTKKTSGGKPNPRKETVEPFSSRVADYWLAIPSKEYNELVKQVAKAKGKLDGTIDVAWSAAFVSYCMQMAGAGPAFPYAAGHATWMVQSIKNKRDGKLKAPLVGFRPGQIALQPGDLIAKPRQPNVTYNNAVQTGWFKSHSDIVVEVDTKKKIAYAIGGNVGQSVSKTEVAITSGGMLDDPGGWIVHIQNNIELKAAVVASIAFDEIKAG